MHFTLCDMLSDLTQNAVEAGSSSIRVTVRETDRELQATIEDNGKGMTPAELKRAEDPFYTDGIKHPGRKVGLGIPFLIQTAESTGGSWSIKSNKADPAGSAASGTTVEARFDLTNIDTPPVGDVPGFFRQILTFDGAYEMEISRLRDRGRGAAGYTVRRSELLDALGLSEAGAFTDAGALSLVGQYLESLEEDHG
ncbi:MAG TPA: sensor histidine kinase [Treponemataceae bacterium]|nr:sensor histidine kinase [Treponemataceae bacterium]